MRRLASLLLPVLALSACVGPAYGPRAGGRYDQRASERWYDRDDLPLAARITDRGGSDFSVDLNRPAYVAVFEILPGQGVGLLYPRYEREDAYFPAGLSSLDLRHAARDYNWYSGSMSAARYSRSEPRSYFLVASKRPLRISRFQRGGGGALRSVLGLSAYGAVDQQAVMNDLVGAIVPDQPAEDWTTDVFTVWPSRGNHYYYAEYPRQYVQVYCGDGTYDIVPVELSRFACGRFRGGIVNQGGYGGGYYGGGNSNGGNVPPPRGRDTTHVTTPGRRRPEPLTGAGETGGASPTRRPRPVGRPETETPGTPRGGGGEPRVAPVEGPRREPRAAPREEPRPEPQAEPQPQAPRVEPRAEPRREVPRRETPVERSEPQERPRAEPLYQAPRAEPVAPPREAPRSEPVYTAPPRAETPRAEPVHTAPPPRSEPVHSAPPQRSEPVYSAPSPPPSPPPAPPSEPAPRRVSSPVEPAGQR